MSTLLLRLAAPLQSWGVSSKFDRRMSNQEPSRSGVIGLLAAALGLQRGDSLVEFESLKFGVRIDQPGRLEKDFQMVHKEEGSKTSSWLTYRYYLEDAVFLAALEGEDNFLKELETAIQNPIFPLFLGRRSCPPSSPLCLGIRESEMRETLLNEPWQASIWYQKKAIRKKIDYLEIVRDATLKEESYSVRDVPKSFSQLRRQYNFRNVIREHIALTDIMKERSEVEVPTEHDPMELLEG